MKAEILALFSFLLGSILLIKAETSTGYHIVIRAGSTLKIHGLTNVNTFDLSYIIKNSVELHPLVTLSDSCYSVTTGKLIVPLRNFEANNAQLKNDFLALVKEKQYPNMILSTNCFYFLKSGSNNLIQKGIAEVAITLGGITRFYSIQFIASGHKANKSYLVEGHQTINIRDFNLEPPTKFFGLIQVKEMIEIDFNLRLSIY